MITARRSGAIAAAPFAALALVVSLTGCSAASDALQREATHEFATHDELAEGWQREAPWLPADAESIVARESVTGEPASVVAVSDNDLDPAQCAEVERLSAPTISIPGAPDAYAVDHVFACGAWSVMATEDGWFGWTPNHPDERAQSPAS